MERTLRKVDRRRIIIATVYYRRRVCTWPNAHLLSRRREIYVGIGIDGALFGEGSLSRDAILSQRDNCG